VNFEHAYLALMTPGLDRLSYSTFVGDEQLLPNVPRFAARGLFAYVAGQVGVLTGAPGFGNYLGAVRLP
jgi:hypothetical protein